MAISFAVFCSVCFFRDDFIRSFLSLAGAGTRFSFKNQSHPKIIAAHWRAIPPIARPAPLAYLNPDLQALIPK